MPEMLSRTLTPSSHPPPQAVGVTRNSAPRPPRATVMRTGSPPCSSGAISAAAVTGVDGDDFAFEGLAALDGGGLLRVADHGHGAEGAEAEDGGGEKRKRTEFTNQNKGFHGRHPGYFVDYLHFMPGLRGYAIQLNRLVRFSF